MDGYYTVHKPEAPLANFDQLVTLSYLFPLTGAIHIVIGNMIQVKLVYSSLCCSCYILAHSTERHFIQNKTTEGSIINKSQNLNIAAQQNINQIYTTGLSDH